MSRLSPTAHRPLTTRFVGDARAISLSFRARTLWFLGYPEAALADVDHAVKDAREIGQAATLMIVLFLAPLPISSAETTWRQPWKRTARSIPSTVVPEARSERLPLERAMWPRSCAARPRRPA